MFKTNFSGHNTMWGGTKIFGGLLPPNAGYGPAFTISVISDKDHARSLVRFSLTSS